MKAREQGNALVLTVPKKFNVKKDTEFIAMKGSNNSIVYVPKIDNPFKANHETDLREELLTEEWVDE